MRVVKNSKCSPRKRVRCIIAVKPVLKVNHWGVSFLGGGEPFCLVDSRWNKRENHLWVWARYGSKLNDQGTAGFGHWFYLPAFRFGYFFFTHSHFSEFPLS